MPEVKEAIIEETVSLASTLLGQDVPEKEVFEAPTELKAWEKMNSVFLERQ